MPGFNRKGPEGQGSRTGRELGKCNPNNQKANEQPDESENYQGMGRRFGQGMGSGSGRGTGKGMARRQRRGNS